MFENVMKMALIVDAVEGEKLRSREGEKVGIDIGKMFVMERFEASFLFKGPQGIEGIDGGSAQKASSPFGRHGNFLIAG